MSSKNIYIILYIVVFFWVGGWAFLMFRYPKFFADFNARFGLRMFSSPKHLPENSESSNDSCWCFRRQFDRVADIRIEVV
jgi:hypothetical protein